MACNKQCRDSTNGAQAWMNCLGTQSPPSSTYRCKQSRHAIAQQDIAHQSQQIFKMATHAKIGKRIWLFKKKCCGDRGCIAATN